MTNWSLYLPCDECGAPAERACRDDANKPKAPCDARKRRPTFHERLAAAAEVAAAAAAAARQAQREAERLAIEARAISRAAAREMKQADVDVMRLKRAEIEANKRYQQRERQRRATATAKAKRAKERQAERARIDREKAITLECWWCKATLPVVGRSRGPATAYPCCGDHACRKAIKRDRQIKARAASQRADPLAAE